MTMKIDNNFILSELKERINNQYHDKVLKQGQLIKAEWLNQPQKPENLVDQVILKILKILEIPENSIVSQNRIKLYDIFKDKKYAYPDFKLVKHRKSEKNLLVKLEPYNSDLQEGIKQAEEWIEDVNIGSYNNALITNLNKFTLIIFEGNIVKEKKISVEKACEFILEIVFGKRITIKLDEINKIIEQFYNHFYALIHGGKYTNSKGEKMSISFENCIMNNLFHADSLTEIEKIEFIYTIFNRLIFIKILMGQGQFPKIFDYLRQIPKHLIYTDLNNLFFKTLSVKKEDRVNTSKEYKDIPFLNGSLFRVSNIEKNNPDLAINPKYLLKIFDFLEEYSFLNNTGKNSSINSEILGYIFEKTFEFRKGTGSYYTHNIICDFMCENVLYPHLLAKTNKYLLSLGYRDKELLESFEEIFVLKEKTLLTIYESIVKKIKICDICVGSGAFLLSMGNLLLEIHKRFLKILHQDYDEIELKQFIMESNLYGVDIASSAIEICQLRLWLWISEHSAQLMPLPNIEYNLRVGNSLLGSDSKIDVQNVNFRFLENIKNSPYFELINQRDQKIINELENGVISFSSLRKLKIVLLDLYLYSHDKDTDRLKDLIEDINEQIVENADLIYLNLIRRKIKNKKLQKDINANFLRRLKAFHWYIEFPHVFPEGFDIIVGNPPYVSIKFMEKTSIEQEIQDLSKKLEVKNKKLKKLKSKVHIDKCNEEIKVLEQVLKKKDEQLNNEYYQQEKIFNSIYKEFLRENYDWAYKIYDILIPFFERGFRLLKNDSTSYLCFITSNKFLATDYGEVIRKYFLTNFQIDLLVDISMIKVFKDAAVYPVIISVKNAQKVENHKIQVSRYKDINDLGTSLVSIEQNRYNKKETKYLIYIPLYYESFDLFDKLLDCSNCLLVKDEFVNYYREFDFTNWEDYEGFVTDNPGKNLGHDYFYYVTNNDIEPFRINVLKLKYFHREFPKKANPKRLKLDQEKWNLFKKELLLIKEIALDLTCALGQNYANIGKIYALELRPDSRLNGLSNYYFLALFNSKLLDFYFRVMFWNTHLSGGYMNYHFSYLSLLPILNIDANSIIYKKIVLLSKCLTILYDETINVLLNFLIIHVYLPDEFEIPYKILELLNNYLNSQISNKCVQEIAAKLKSMEIELVSLYKHKIYQTIVKERMFNE